MQFTRHLPAAHQARGDPSRSACGDPLAPNFTVLVPYFMPRTLCKNILSLSYESVIFAENHSRIL